MAYTVKDPGPPMEFSVPRETKTKLAFRILRKITLLYSNGN